MSDLPIESNQNDKKKAMWPTAAVILLIVFAPALLMWALNSLHV